MVRKTPGLAASVVVPPMSGERSPRSGICCALDPYEKPRLHGGGDYRLALALPGAATAGQSAPTPEGALTGSDASAAKYRPGSPGVGDPYFPLEGNGGYNVKHYALNLSYDPASHHLGGSNTITAVPPRTCPGSTSTCWASRCSGSTSTEPEQCFAVPVRS